MILHRLRRGRRFVRLSAVVPKPQQRLFRLLGRQNVGNVTDQNFFQLAESSLVEMADTHEILHADVTVTPPNTAQSTEYPLVLPAPLSQFITKVRRELLFLIDRIYRARSKAQLDSNSERSLSIAFPLNSFKVTFMKCCLEKSF